MRDHFIIAAVLAAWLRAHEMLALDVGDVYEDGVRVQRRVQLRVDERSHDMPSAQEAVVSDGRRAMLVKLHGWKEGRAQSLAPDAPFLVSRNGDRRSGG